MTSNILPQTPQISNTYLAYGKWHGFALMKVGKTINVANRQKELTLRIEFSCPCYTPEEATAFEASLRAVMRNQGAEQFMHRYDWFVFNKHVYQAAVGHMLDCAPHGNVYQYPPKLDKHDLHALALNPANNWRFGTWEAKAS